MRNRTHVGNARALIVDPEFTFGLPFADWLAGGGYHPILVRYLDPVVDQLRDIDLDVIVLSLESTQQDGATQHCDGLRLVRSACPSLPVIAITKSSPKAWVDIFLRDSAGDISPIPVELTRMVAWIQTRLDTFPFPACFLSANQALRE